MSDHQAPTGQITTVTLPSALEQVVWTEPAAVPGAQATLEVFSRFVGNGAPMQIKLTDHTGKTHGTFNESLYANRFSVSMQVPAEAEVALYAEVKLPDHGVTQQSGPLLLAPPIRIERCAWSAEEARRGDMLTLTADVKGAVDGAEAQVAIYEHDADGAHDLVTVVPAVVRSEAIEVEWAFEYVEDTDDIPTDPELEQGYTVPEYFFRVRVLGVEAESPILRFKDWIEYQFLDAYNAPRTDLDAIVVRMPDGTEQRVPIDDQATALLSDIPPGPFEIVEFVFKKQPA